MRTHSLWSLAFATSCVVVCVACDDELDAVPGSVSGVVCDVASGVGVSVPVGLGSGAVVASDASGRYRFANVAAGEDVVVVVGVDDHERSFDVVVVSGEDSVVVDSACRELPAGFGDIDGVVCGDDHEFLDDALVTVVVGDEEVASARTGVGGAFHVDHVAAGSVVVAVRARGFGRDFAVDVRGGETTVIAPALTCADELTELPVDLEGGVPDVEGSEGEGEGEATQPTPPPVPVTPPSCTPQAEICENDVDEDCDGRDNACDPISVDVDIDGDCVTARCPASAPHPVGCDIDFQGGDERGCVANNGGAVVYFQEGDACGAGHLEGQLYCSSFLPPEPLNEDNCPINKQRKFYPDDRDGCPETD